MLDASEFWDIIELYEVADNRNVWNTDGHDVSNESSYQIPRFQKARIRGNAI